jgi:hypothetical protein
VFNPLWAWLAQGERPGRLAVAGGLVILAATAWRSWSERRVAPDTGSPAPPSPA